MTDKYESPEYMKRIDMLVGKARMGDLGMGDRQILEDALKGLAPSSPRYRTIVGLLGHGAFGSESDSQMPPAKSAGPPLPTLDFLMGSKSKWGPGGEDTRSRLEAMGGTHLAGNGGRDEPRPGDTRPANTNLLLPAEEHDQEDQGGGTHQESEPDWGEPIGMTRTPTNEDALMLRDAAGSLGVGKYFSEGPEGDYSFSDTSPAMRDLIRSNPDVYANIIYKDQPVTREFMTPYLQAAESLSTTGMLGGGNPADQSLRGGPSSSTMQMAATEDFMKQFDQPGSQFVDPGQVYGGLFGRLENTDPATMVNDRGEPAGISDQVAISNRALFNAAPFMADSARQYLAARLDQAGNEYLTKLATGEIDQTMTYPAYLQSIGADTWLTG